LTETLYRAAFVLPVTAPPIRDGFVLVREGRVVAFGPTADRPTHAGIRETDLGNVILMPGFANAHTHLELSHLDGAVPAKDGFVTWIEDQLRVRAEKTDAEAARAIHDAVAGLEASGTVAVADVTNSLAALGALAESSLHALVLHEILGFDPARADGIAEQTRSSRTAAEAAAIGDDAERASRIRVAVAAHAPHSISRELFARLLEDGIRSIHVAESRAEDVFLRDGSGEWRAFLDRRVGRVPFEAPGTAPVSYLDRLGVLTPGLLAVHCVRVNEDDAKLLAARGAIAVLCPRSNAFLGNGVPPLALLLGNGVRIALGTDSLASCASLDVLEDARLLARTFPRVPKAVLLHALTKGGCEALGFKDLGEIRTGARAPFAALPFDGRPPADPVAFLFNESVPARRVA
jgi:cytosine/adenosine deaminase-related metal-dependent hydrolase